MRSVQGKGEPADPFTALCACMPSRHWTNQHAKGKGKQWLSNCSAHVHGRQVLDPTNTELSGNTEPQQVNVAMLKASMSPRGQATGGSHCRCHDSGVTGVTHLTDVMTAV
eukprot:1144214-Pelagomonas_calceolata.AAC.1